MRVIDRVHDDAAVVRAPAQPTSWGGGCGRPCRSRCSCGQGSTPRRWCRGIGRAPGAARPNEAEDDVVLIAADDLGVGAGGPRQLAALADLQLDIVHDGADRHVAERHDIARLDVDMVAGNDRIAHGKPLRRQDVGLLAVLIFDQRDERGAVRIVFQPLDGCGNVDLVALEVDQAVGLLGGRRRGSAR